MKRLYSIDGDGASRTIDAAVAAISSGDLVAIPTETVYGLAADAQNDKAVAKIFSTKGRPSFNPLIAHVSGLEMAETLAKVNQSALDLATTFWPGPLTLVMPQKDHAPLSPLATAGLKTVAVRCPAHPIAKKIIESFGSAIVAPSANKSGHLSPTSAERVLEGFHNDDQPVIIIDGGSSSIGIESTIIDATSREIKIIRPGSITIEDISEKTDVPVNLSNDAQAASTGAIKPIAPGQLASHYAPVTTVRLNATSPDENEVFLAFRSSGDLEKPFSEVLSETGDLKEAAANLYEMLWRLDVVAIANGLDRIAVAPIPDDGIGAAINDRLRRAAAPR
ncbi:MAG: L-threonylcarbamoyladenylate synthase [Pseudomonadota bacterium]